MAQGVWRLPGGGYKASIWNGVPHRPGAAGARKRRKCVLGRFTCATEAAAAFDRAARAVMGPRALTNFPPPPGTRPRPRLRPHVFP